MLVYPEGDLKKKMVKLLNPYVTIKLVAWGWTSQGGYISLRQMDDSNLERPFQPIRFLTKKRPLLADQNAIFD